MDIFIPELRGYVWDIEYRVICKFFQENIGEAPQTVVKNDLQWDVNNYNVWQFLEIRVGKILLRIF